MMLTITDVHAQEQRELQRQQDESLAEYEEIKKELVADTAFVGALVSHPPLDAHLRRSRGNVPFD